MSARSLGVAASARRRMPNSIEKISSAVRARARFVSIFHLGIQNLARLRFALAPGYFFVPVPDLRCIKAQLPTLEICAPRDRTGTQPVRSARYCCSDGRIDLLLSHGTVPRGWDSGTLGQLFEFLLQSVARLSRWRSVPAAKRLGQLSQWDSEPTWDVWDIWDTRDSWDTHSSAPSLRATEDFDSPVRSAISRIDMPCWCRALNVSRSSPDLIFDSCHDLPPAGPRTARPRDQRTRAISRSEFRTARPGRLDSRGVCAGR